MGCEVGEEKLEEPRHSLQTARPSCSLAFPGSSFVMTVPSRLSLLALRGRDVISSAPPVMKSAPAASGPAETASSTQSRPVSDNAGRNLKLETVKSRSSYDFFESVLSPGQTIHHLTGL
ncbi:unnamed protein product [Tetraodon nigroviridis]|uniref:(spotted green pufferfish) hypothetical protein n=1 Tax=Tetraodon nigroviridis TaxID=99883 RepID=Q4SLK4_TETNG|nr:unnamed protein product [Tetraodon nigroviridis]